ncbi:MAG TPA: hypothetical protein VE734_03820, partial [Terriglobales bacterium]|nr:hypothetical protein [Terriglobales bacterium]
MKDTCPYRATKFWLCTLVVIALALPAMATVTGGGFTTFDQTIGGCLDHKNGINCNNYADKADVYITGGPIAASLGPGCYYFSVLVPGFQNGGFIDGADGNLSDGTRSHDSK